MRTGFFLGLIVVAVLVLGPLITWSLVDLDGSPLQRPMRFVLLAGVALGGFLLLHVILRAFFSGRD
jgi:hypothetical protein